MKNLKYIMGLCVILIFFNVFIMCHHVSGNNDNVTQVHSFCVMTININVFNLYCVYWNKNFCSFFLMNILICIFFVFN